MISNPETEMIRYPLFVKWIKMSWFFLNNDRSGSGLLTDMQIKEGIKKCKLPIKLTKKDKEEFEDLLLFLTSNSSFMLNYKHFISFFLYDYAFEHLVVPGFKTEVTYLSILKELKHIGYFLNKNTINKAV
jgi:hypothetical protein